MRVHNVYLRDIGPVVEFKGYTHSKREALIHVTAVFENGQEPLLVACEKQSLGYFNGDRSALDRIYAGLDAYMLDHGVFTRNGWIAHK